MQVTRDREILLVDDNDDDISILRKHNFRDIDFVSYDKKIPKEYLLIPIYL
jgi:hypothetical protein